MTVDGSVTIADSAPPMIHRPHGSGHPYRQDLDQRVPVQPMADEPFEIRIVASSDVRDVTVELSDGSRIVARHVDAADLVQEVGPYSAGTTAEGHLASAAEASRLAQGAAVWVATATISSALSYRITGVLGGATLTTEGFDVDPAHWADDGGRIAVAGEAHARLEPASVRWLVGSVNGPARVRFRLRLDPDQHIVGLGERYATVDHRGEVLDAVVFEQYKHQGRRTYLPVPMAVVVGGDHWGFHVVTTRRTWFDLGASDPDWIVVEAEVDPDDPVLQLSLWSGPPNKVVQRFLDATGQPPVPAPWIFEPWMSGNEWNTQERVEQEVGRSLREGIAVGVVVIEAWSDESTFVAFRDATYEVHPDGRPHRLADFTFPPDGAWPDPVGMVRRLHEQGVRVLLWQIPLVPTDRGETGQVAADAAALESRGLCVREADGTAYRNRGWWFPGALLPDFTDPEARRWWRERRRYLLDEVRIDGFKTDGGEHPWGRDLEYADGTCGAESNNRFPVLFGQTFHELIADVGSDGITFSRAGFTGSAAFPGHWSGDDDSTWEGLRAAIRAGLSAGVAGIYYWGWDLAGFSGPIPDAELYLRSAALAALCPIMQYHAEFNDHRVPSNDRTPWNIAERTGDPAVLSGFRRFAELRHRLVPYLAEQSERSVASGRPLMRSLCFDHPDDPEIWAVPLQFQLGDDLLVVPVTEPGAAGVSAYLPAGEWVDAFTGEVHAGGGWAVRAVGLDEIAVYRRAISSPTLDGVFGGVFDGCRSGAEAGPAAVRLSTADRPQL